MKTICVYLGASSESNPVFKKAVIKLAHEIVSHRLSIVSDGSSLGMMGLLAETVKELGGKVVGVITTHPLDKEKPLDILNELHIVSSMQERKRMLQQLADTFVVMPSGLGALEKAIETWNAIKIGEPNKKIDFLNVDNYFIKLFIFIEHCNKNGFILAEQTAIPSIQVEPKKLLRDLILPKYEEIDCVM